MSIKSINIEDKNVCLNCGYVLKSGDVPIEAEISITRENSYYMEWVCPSCGKGIIQWYTLTWKENEYE